MTTSKDTISHYGVKGMKWGVRKDIAKGNVDAYRSKILERHEKRTAPITEAEYKGLTNKKSTIAKENAEAYRIANAASSGLTGKTYITLDKRDNNVYAALLDPSGDRKAKKVQLDLMVKEDLVSPSKRERIDTFIETLDSDIPFAGRMHKGRDFVSAAMADKALSTHELGLKYYEKFAQTQTMDTPLSSKYFQEIAKKGYNSLVDDADAGIITRMPVIVLDSSKSLEVRTSAILDKLSVMEAQEKLKDYLN